jgi:exonuclease SbcC
LHLTIEGFSAYRKRTEIDFADVDYFSLSGPTGSGKSSLVDAMVFALYGRVPRLGGSTVAPVISTGRDQATVSFEFMVADQVYTVIRDLHRTKSGGASVREARLERGSVSLESGASNVTNSVEELLRLSFEDFSRTVILPQGEFARFLKATPSDRQQLLRGLMGLDVYSEVGSRSRAREAVAKSASSEARARLDGLELPSQEEMDAQTTRLQAIEQLAAVVSESEQAISESETSVRDLQKVVDGLDDARERLQALAPPERLEEIGRLVGEASDKVAVLHTRQRELSEQVDLVKEKLFELPSLESIERAETVIARLLEVEAELSNVSIGDFESELAAAEVDVAELSGALEQSRFVLESSRIAHAAHDLATKLSVGDVCPVCDHLIDSAPEIVPPADLAAAKAGEKAADQSLARGRERVSLLTEQLAVQRAQLSALAKKKQELEGDTPDFDLASVPEVKSQVLDLLHRKSAFDEEIAGIAKSAKDAQRVLEDLAEQQRSLGIKLMAQREALADLKPNPNESDDPIVQWKELLVWRDSALTNTESELSVRSDELGEATRVLSEARHAVVEALEAVEIVAEGNYSVAVARAHEHARHRVEEFEKRVEESKALATQIEEKAHYASVAHELSQHLRADGFERWLMVGAIANLVVGANSLLGQLSGGGYSLIADASGSFDVIDHHSANEVRPISTLSGGETFLVSLSLALSLAETLSASGGAGLDAIILDEGFGTLDEELLEVVATVLEDLAGRGLMVGIITHVKELAGLAPVRYRVRKEPDGSVVERVS